MPRFSNEGPAVSEWCVWENEGSSTRDLCHICANKIAGKPWPVEECEGIGEPAGVHCPGDVEHPPYEDSGDDHWSSYDCDQCGHSLGSKDN